MAVIVKDSFDELPSLLEGRRVFCVYDRNVSELVRDILESVPVLSSLCLYVSEESKTFAAAEEICRFLLESGADRDSIVLAVGGGVTCDLAGFAASVYMRGVSWAAVPTTLLAQVDAAIGGKTGVNLDGYKNMIGCFHQPEFTYIDTAALRTLPERELLSGAAEMLKTFIIGDAVRYEKAVAYFSGRGSCDLTELVRSAAAVKSAVVAEDEREAGMRRVLNLGHTFGHAAERYSRSCPSRKPLLHGEAVAIGIVAAAGISEKLGCCERGLAARLRDDFLSCGLPVDPPCPLRELAGSVSKDKKVSGEGINFAVVEQLGRVSVRYMTKNQLLELI